MTTRCLLAGWRRMPDQIDPCSGDDLKSIVAVWTEHWAASIYGQEAVSLHNHPYVVLHDLQTKYSSQSPKVHSVIMLLTMQTCVVNVHMSREKKTKIKKQKDSSVGSSSTGVSDFTLQIWCFSRHFAFDWVYTQCTPYSWVHREWLGWKLMLWPRTELGPPKWKSNMLTTKPLMQIKVRNKFRNYCMELMALWHYEQTRDK